jgi:hypothetical protein
MKNATASVDFQQVGQEELSEVSGGMKQIGGLVKWDRATIFHPADEVAVYVDGMYFGQGFRT